MQAIIITSIICYTIIILSLISKLYPRDTEYDYEETEDKEDEKD